MQQQSRTAPVAAQVPPSLQYDRKSWTPRERRPCVNNSEAALCIKVIINGSVGVSERSGNAPRQRNVRDTNARTCIPRPLVSLVLETSPLLFSPNFIPASEKIRTVYLEEKCTNRVNSRHTTRASQIRIERTRA